MTTLWVKNNNMAVCVYECFMLRNCLLQRWCFAKQMSEYEWGCWGYYTCGIVCVSRALLIYTLSSNKPVEPQGGHQRIPVCCRAVPRRSPRWQLTAPNAHIQNTGTKEAKHGFNLEQYKEYSSFHDCVFILRQGLPQLCDVCSRLLWRAPAALLGPNWRKSPWRPTASMKPSERKWRVGW